MQSVVISSDCECINETKYAIFVVLMNFVPYKAIWVPKISLSGFGNIFANGDIGTLSVNKTFASRKLDSMLVNASNSDLVDVGSYAEVIEDYANSYLMEFNPKPNRLRIVIPKGVMIGGDFTPTPFMSIVTIKWWADIHCLSGHKIDYRRAKDVYCVFDNAIAVAETAKAICVSFGYTNGKEEWIPKSVIGCGSEVDKIGDTGKIVVAAWYANKNGWV